MVRKISGSVRLIFSMYLLYSSYIKIATTKKKRVPAFYSQYPKRNIVNY